MKDNFATRYLLFFFILLAALFAVRKAGWGIPISVTTSSVSSELSVVGEGKVDVTPDTVYVDVGVTVQREQTADAVQAKLADQNNKIVEAMKAIGINKDGIKTSNFSINPNYIYDGGKQRTDGFTGNATVTVKTDKIDLAGKIIEEATSAGATNIGGTRFTVDNPEKYRADARDKAIANAKDQAQRLASSLGITLGKITNIVESNSSAPVPMYFSEKSVSISAAGGAADLSAGTQTISSTVTLFFEKR